MVTAEGASVRSSPAVSVVMITWNRVDSVLATLARLTALPDGPPIVVVDNGSSDGTAAAVRRAYPAVDVLALRENRGAAGRNLGAQRCTSPYVAFSDDDSWWAPEALPRASALLDAHPEVALLAARVLVQPGDRPDPVCAAMSASPLGTHPGDPGPQVLGFIACGSVVRRQTFLDCGGFDRRFGVGGEEELLALDLATAGWRSVYAADVVAHHQPATGGRDALGRQRTQTRNALTVAWTRLPVSLALLATARTVGGGAWRHRGVRHGLVDAVRQWHDLWSSRRPVPRRVQQLWSTLARADHDVSSWRRWTRPSWWRGRPRSR